jgi:hypothetical protein
MAILLLVSWPQLLLVVIGRAHNLARIDFSLSFFLSVEALATRSRFRLFNQIKFSMKKRCSLLTITKRTRPLAMGKKGEWVSGLLSLDYFSFLGGRFPTTNERPRKAAFYR